MSGTGPRAPWGLRMRASLFVSWSLWTFFSSSESFLLCLSISSLWVSCPSPSCPVLHRPLPSPHECSPLLLPLDTHSSHCWLWSLRNVNWPPARPAMGPGLGWAHPWVVTSAPPIPSMRTSQPLLSRWAPQSTMHQNSQGGGQAGDKMCPPRPLSSSQVRSERPLFSSNPELDNLVRPGPPTMLPSLRGSPGLPSIALGLVGGAERRPPDPCSQIVITSPFAMQYSLEFENVDPMA